MPNRKTSRWPCWFFSFYMLEVEVDVTYVLEGFARLLGAVGEPLVFLGELVRAQVEFEAVLRLAFCGFAR